MVYSVSNLNLLIIWGCNLVIVKAYSILRLPTICSFSSILVKFVTVVEGDQKDLFTIASTLRCWRRALLLSLDYSILPLILTLYCWVLSKEVSSTIFKVFGMTQSGIEPRSSGTLSNTLPTRLMSRFIGMMVRVFANGPRYLGSIPGRVIPKTQKIVLAVSLLNTQQYKVGIKGRMEQSREKSSAPPKILCSS